MSGNRLASGTVPLALPLLFFLAAGSPEQRAIDFLSTEVPAWNRDNHCYSCHNNGDGARALFAARARGYRIPAAVLADTIRWLEQPANWDNNHGNPGFSDIKLARIQFAASLAQAALPDRKPLLDAAASLLKYQAEDGAWHIDTGGMPGAPAIYGVTLGTYSARRTLEAADRTRFAEPIARATAWLRAAQPANLLDRAAILLALPDRRELAPALLAAQTSDGGWGSQKGLAAEPFDTAIAILALNSLGEKQAVERGRRYLIAAQQKDGSWMETTRPSGQISYAEHLSTTGWALYALLLTLI